MEAIAGGGERGPVVSATVAASSLAVLGLTVAAGLPVTEVAMVVAGLVALALCYRTALRWHSLLAGMLLVIMFVPIKRYGLPGNLPFDLEPYRVVVAVIAAGWMISLLIDPRVRLRASGLEAPLAMIAVTAFASVLVNGERVDSLKVGPEVIKGLMFLLSFMLVFYLIVSVVRTPAHVHSLVRLTTGCGGFVALCSIFEARTGWNAFDHLASLIPLLSPEDVVGNISRGGRLRVYGSAQGAIPLGAALAFLVPLGVYMVRSSTRRVLWLSVLCLLLLGTLATGSRTG